LAKKKRWPAYPPPTAGSFSSRVLNGTGIQKNYDTPANKQKTCWENLVLQRSVLIGADGISLLAPRGCLACLVAGFTATLRFPGWWALAVGGYYPRIAPRALIGGAVVASAWLASFGKKQGPVFMKVDSTHQPSAALEASSIGIEALIALVW
jgi:hypothetical protein